MQLTLGNKNIIGIMLMKSWFFLFTITIIFCSCSSLKHASKAPGLIELSPLNVKLLNGKYHDNPVQQDTANRTSLSWEIFNHGYNISDSRGYIELEVVDSNKILISIHNGNSVVKSKVFYGRIKDGYFQFKRKWLIMPLVFTNLFRNRLIRIGISDNHNLVTDYDQISYGTYNIIIPFYIHIKQPKIEFKKRD